MRRKYITYITIFSLTLLLLTSFSCQGDKSQVLAPQKKVSIDVEKKIDDRGVLTEAVNVETSDKLFAINVPAGTKALDKDREPLKELTLEPPDKEPPAPPDRTNIAVADFGPDGITFDKPVEVTLSYDPGSLPENASPDDLIMAYYDEELEEWVELADITVDTANHTVTGKVKHFTIFAIQVKVTEEKEEEKKTAEFRPIYRLPILYSKLPDLTGQKIWAVGYYGDPSFAHGDVAFLVEDFDMLLVNRVIPRESFARLDGNIPSPGMSGRAILVYGTLKDFGQTYRDLYAANPTPLITVEKYEVLDVKGDGKELIDYLAWSPYWDRLIGSAGTIQLVSFLSGPLSPGRIAQPADAEAAEAGTQAKDCDRALIISGGVDNAQNHSHYADNVKAMYEKMLALGYNV